MNANKRGLFIVFEGCDRCGKTTQSRLLLDALKRKGILAKQMNFPDRSTAIGQLINSYLTNAQELSDEMVHLLFSANRWERMKSIRKQLLAGTSIICDRYAYSGVAYTAAKGYDFDWCCAPDRGLPKPDAVFYLQLSPEELQARGGFGGERFVHHTTQYARQTALMRCFRSNSLQLREDRNAAQGGRHLRPIRHTGVQLLAPARCQHIRRAAACENCSDNGQSAGHRSGSAAGPA
ncbi:hypothetical protein KR222_000415 [Zaprionus bogoriensis]|nr:hypothetical protein KR222_000415 [Zaprionus bogoriensis]